MPEDYQAILSDLGVDTSADQAAATQPAPASNANVDAPETTDNSTLDTTATEAPATATEQPVTKPEEPLVSDEQRKQNEAFAAMRTENSKYKKFLQQIMKGANYQGSEADFMNALEDASYKQQAQAQGNQVSPELLKRMDSLENQNHALLESQNRQMFMSNLKGLQDTYKLTDKDLKEFVDLAVREKIDLTVPGTNFVTLYRGLFFDKLKDKMVEEARQEWIGQNNKANNAANPDGKSGKKDPEPTNVNTMAEFNSLLQSMPINNK